MADAHPRPPADCPVCGFTLTVSRLTCGACGTELTGRFTPCPLCALSEEDVALVHALIGAAGDMDDTARRTGLGADVVRQRLQDAAGRLGLAPSPAEPVPAASDIVPVGEADDDFLQRLARGVVDADEALRHLP